MNFTTAQKRARHIGSVTLALLAFVALLMPVVIPGLEPGLVGVQAFHGHVALDGVVEPHSHDLDSADDTELIFTSDDSGSSSSSLVIITPVTEKFAPIGELIPQSPSVEDHSGQWSPGLPTTPPKLSA